MGATTDTNRRGINSTETTVQSLQAFKDAKGGSKYITRNVSFTPCGKAYRRHTGPELHTALPCRRDARLEAGTGFGDTGD